MGEHLRKVRIDRNESQLCVAHLLRLTRSDSLANWELNYFQPLARFNPWIIDYLGYTPLFNLAGSTRSKRIQSYLFVHGYSRKERAEQIGIDPISLTKLIDEKKGVTYPTIINNH